MDTAVEEANLCAKPLDEIVGEAPCIKGNNLFSVYCRGTITAVGENKTTLNILYVIKDQADVNTAVIKILGDLKENINHYLGLYNANEINVIIATPQGTANEVWKTIYNNTAKDSYSNTLIGFLGLLTGILVTLAYIGYKEEFIMPISLISSAAYLLSFIRDQRTKKLYRDSIRNIVEYSMNA